MQYTTTMTVTPCFVYLAIRQSPYTKNTSPPTLVITKIQGLTWHPMVMDQSFTKRGIKINHLSFNLNTKMLNNSGRDRPLQTCKKKTSFF